MKILVLVPRVYDLGKVAILIYICMYIAPCCSNCKIPEFIGNSLFVSPLLKGFIRREIGIYHMSRGNFVENVKEKQECKYYFGIGYLKPSLF